MFLVYDSVVRHRNGPAGNVLPPAVKVYKCPTALYTLPGHSSLSTTWISVRTLLIRRQIVTCTQSHSYTAHQNVNNSTNFRPMRSSRKIYTQNALSSWILSIKGKLSGYARSRDRRRVGSLADSNHLTNAEGKRVRCRMKSLCIGEQGGGKHVHTSC